MEGKLINQEFRDMHLDLGRTEYQLEFASAVCKAGVNRVTAWCQSRLAAVTTAQAACALPVSFTSGNVMPAVLPLTIENKESSWQSLVH